MNFKSHEEIDEHFKKRLDAVTGDDVWANGTRFVIFDDWRRMKEDFDKYGYAPARNARIVNLSVSNVMEEL